MNDDAVGAIAVILIFGGPLAALIVWRVLAHQERIEMIRRGMMPPPDPRIMGGWRPGYGPGPFPSPGGSDPSCMYASSPGAPEPDYYAQAQLRKGVMLTMVGFALLLGLSFIGPLNRIFFFGPWMLGGLIPMFVGVAQIINALLNGARLPSSWGSWGPPGSQRYAPPPGQAQTGTSRVEPPPGPYAWRPGPEREIPKPTPPPDRK
jgi:hypothetical protein